MNRFIGEDWESNDRTHLNKAQILQEAKQLFKATSPKTSKLIDVLTKSIYLISEREKLAPNEATDLFFQVTRLFQFKDKDAFLRKLIYVTIKALSQQAENVYVVTSSLTTDVNSSRDDPAIRASALRALCQISDAATFASIEKYVKQSIVDRHPVVASAAISSLIKITSVNSEIAKRCTNEVQQALDSESPMVQYHALGLRYASCQGDRHSVARLIGDCISQGLRSPLAICLLIKIITTYIDEGDGQETKPYRDYIKNHINHRSDMVEYEAANALVNLKFASNSSNSRRAAVAHLRNFLTSPKAALRFAAVRSLNELNSMSGEVRFWSVHKIGNVCRLHLLNKRYKMSDDIIGVLDFSQSKVKCVKYTIVLQCEDARIFQIKQELSLGIKKTDLIVKIPVKPFENDHKVLHCVLTLLLYVADTPKTVVEDRTGTIELGPKDVDTKLFSCDFPIAIYTQ